MFRIRFEDANGQELYSPTEVCEVSCILQDALPYELFEQVYYRKRTLSLKLGTKIIPLPLHAELSSDATIIVA